METLNSGKPRGNGSLDGHEVMFTYSHEEDGSGVLEWTSAEESQADSTKRRNDKEEHFHGRISSRDVIGVIKSSQATAEEEYDILAIEHVPSKSSASSSPTSEESSKNSSTGEDPRLYVLHASNLPPALLHKFLLPALPPHLTLAAPPSSQSCGTEPPAPNLHIIISTSSGTSQAASFFAHVLQPTFSALGLRESAYVVHHTRSAQTIPELTRDVFLPRAKKGVAQTLILLSGDGGVHDLVNGLLVPEECTRRASNEEGDEAERENGGTDRGYVPPVVGILALGTGNALAHSLRLTKEAPASLGLRALLVGTPHPLPLFRAVFSPGARIIADEGRKAVKIRKEDVQRAPQSRHGLFHSGTTGGKSTSEGEGESGQRVIYGAIVLSYGLHASLVAESDTAERRKQGSARFQNTARELLFPSEGKEPHAYRARVSFLKAGGQDHGQQRQQEQQLEWTPIPRTDHAYVLSTLVSNLERDFVISPLSSLPRHTSSSPQSINSSSPSFISVTVENLAASTGKMHIVHFPPLPGHEIMRLMSLAYQGGKHVHESVVGYEEVEGVRIELPPFGNETVDEGCYEGGERELGQGVEKEEEEGRWRKVCVDGTIVQLERGGWVEVRRMGANWRSIVDVIY